MELEIPGYDDGLTGRKILEMKRAGWCLGGSYGASSAAQVPERLRDIS